jgi:hypothetical protein
MRRSGVWGAAALLLCGAVSAAAADLSSGLAVGRGMPKYEAIKLGGGEDGVKLGAALCYT